LSEDRALKELQEIEGVGPATARRLAEAGYASVAAVASASAAELSERAGLGLEQALRIIRAAKVKLGMHRVMSAKEYKALRASVPRLTTGVEALDKLLGGGLKAGAVYEVVGPPGVGKTQLCHQLCVTVQLARNKGGVGGGALYIDTEGTFSPERIEAIASRFGLNPDQALSNVEVVRVTGAEEQVATIKEDVPRVLSAGRAKLVVVDSLILIFRGQLRGRERLAERQQLLAMQVDVLRRVCSVFNAYCLVTNEVQAVPDAIFQDELMYHGRRSTGGYVVAHGTSHRLWFRRVRDACEATVVDSYELPAYQPVRFKISAEGLVDA